MSYDEYRQYYQEEDWDCYIPSEILGQQSTIEHRLYSGDLLVSKIVKQSVLKICTRMNIR